MERVKMCVVNVKWRSILLTNHDFFSLLACAVHVELEAFRCVCHWTCLSCIYFTLFSFQMLQGSPSHQQIRKRKRMEKQASSVKLQVRASSKKTRTVAVELLYIWTCASCNTAETFSSRVSSNSEAISEMFPRYCACAYNVNHGQMTIWNFS